MKTLLLKKLNAFGSSGFTLRLTLLFVAMLSGSVVFGQTNIFTYSNSTATIPTGFVLTNNVATNVVDQSTYLLLDAGSPSDFIVTPNYDLSAYSSATLNVNVATFASGTAFPMKIEVSTNGGTSWSATTYTTATPSSATYITGGPIVITQTFTTTTKFRFSNNGTSGRGVRVQNLVLDANAALTTITSNAVVGNWSSTSSWVGGVVPTSANNAVIVSGAVITLDTTTGGINTRNSGTSTTVNAGGTLATAVQYINNGTTTINGAFQLNAGGFTNSGNNFVYGGAGKLIFNNTSSYGVNGADQYWPTTAGPVDVTILQGGMTLNTGVNRTVTGVFQTAAAITLTGALTLSGTVRINTGGSFANAPTYGSSSTLIYNTGSAFTRGNEWTTATSGAGYPANVQLSNPGTVTTLNMGATSAQASGSISIDAATVLNTTSAGLIVVGSVTNNGTISLGGDVTLSGTSGSNWVVGASATQTNNGKAVFFTGASGTQAITKTGGGVVFFDYLVINKAAGSVQLSSTPATSVTINTTAGDVLQLNNAGSLDLNAQTLTLNNPGGNIAASAAGRSITSTVSGATLAITGAKAFSGAGTLTIGANVTTILSAGFDFGVAKVTVNGTLQLNFGGFAVNGSAPTYASNSTLLFNTGGNYDVHNGTADVAGWFRNTASTGTAQAGVPWNVTISNTTTVRYNSTNTDNFPRYINGSLVINSGSGLTLGGISGTAGDFYLRGNWTNSGTFTPNSRQVTFNGTAAQTLTGATTFDYLTLSNSTGLTLANSITVNQTLNFTSGKIALGTNNLTVGASGSITGAGTSSYVITAGTGQLKRTVGGSATLFAVGNTSYNPITFTNSGTSDVYGVNVLDGTYATPLDNTKIVNRRWQVTEAAAGGSNLAVVAQYNTGETAANFNAGATPKIGFYNGTTWTEVIATQAGANPFTFTSNANLSPTDLTSGTQYFGLGKDNAFFSVASQLVITAITPTSPVQDGTFSVTVVSRDASNFAANVVANTSFTLTTNGNAGTIGGTVTGTILAGTNSIVVSGVTLNSFGTGVTITATRTSGDALTAATSSTFTVLAKAVKLAFGTVPATGNVGVNVSAITVQALRGDNTVDVNYTGSITISKASGPGILSGTLTVAAVAGVATFSAAQFDTAGTYTLNATASGLIAAPASSNIVITLAPVVVAGWDFFGAASNPTPTAYAATTFNANLDNTSTLSNITRGAGASASNGGSSFRTTGFQNDGISTSNTDYFQTTLKIKNGYSMNLSSITGNVIGTATYSVSPGVNMQFAYSFDGTTFTLINSPVTVAGDFSTGGVALPAMDVTAVSALQNIPSGTTVYFRFYASGRTTTGGWGFYSATSGTNGLAFLGNVLCAQPTAYTVTGGGNYCPTVAGIAVGLSNSQLGVNYQLKLNGTNTGSPVAGTGAALAFGNQTAVGTYTVVATNTNGSCSVSATMTGSAVVTSSTSWTGGTSNAWATDSNWTCNAPIAGSDVTIGTGTFQPQITTSPIINSLTINSGSTLTVKSGNNITITDVIVNNGTLTLENNANLLQVNDVNNTGTGTNIVNRESSLLMRQDYTLWSSPVEGQQLQAFSPATLSNRFYTYSPTGNIYVAETATNNFTEGKGYLIRTANNFPTTATIWPGRFTGTELHNGNLTLTVTNATYNAIGNPYPSTISADLFIADNDIKDPLYFWRKTNNSSQTTTPTSSYATYTYAGGVGTAQGTADPQHITPNGIIQVGQGFIARSFSGLAFKNSERVANNANQFLRIQEDRSRFWLDLTDNNGFFGEMMVAYMPGATAGVDNAIDGLYFNDAQTALTSIIDDQEYAIQGRGLPFSTTDTVPLGMKSELGGNFTIAINHVDGFFETENTAIYLKDNLLNVTHNLSEGPYSFAAAPGVFNTRFEIVYENLLAVSQPEFTASQVIAYKQNQDIVVNSGSIKMARVQIFDIRGRLLTEQSNINANEAKLNAGSANQVLIVKITSDKNATVTKKVVN